MANLVTVPSSIEWLEPDALGGFAMGTADGIRTRRYHALLLTATDPPDGRRVLVADVEVYVDTPSGRYALSSHRYRGDVVHPDGATHVAAFTHHPWPRWDFHLPDGSRIAYEIVVAPGTPRVCLRWTRIAGNATALHVRPFLAGRDYHATHHENPVFRFEPDQRGETVTWHPYPGVPSISALSDGIYIHGGGWYRRFHYAEEAARGLDAEEDLASPGELSFDLAAGPAHLAFSANGWGDQTATGYVDATFDAERARRAAYPSPLVRAADAYICARGAGKTIIAGYPWFADWGRDTFISLRGLCLTTGRRSVARDILMQWVTAIDGGMLPNRFTESGSHASSPEFNSVDAALWFVIAADAYLAGPPGSITSDDRRALEAGIDAIVAGYAAGTRHRIHADADGLIACGEPGLQLTWMDARVGDDCITPRIGKPIEIQALWINALTIAGRREPSWADLAARATASVVARFWDPSRNQLHDVVDCDHVAGTFDASCRPNQIFAVGLPIAIVDGAIAKAIVDTVEHSLVTPAGVRTLAPRDPRYVGLYRGGPLERDRAYHNGPVWPWLTGTFVEAWLRVYGDRTEARRRFLDPLLARTELAGLDHISEICDGDPPYRPAGCPFQAWSVAEAIRISELLSR